MQYRLVVLSHGDNRTLQATVESFLANVRPKPAEAVLIYDGPAGNVRPQDRPAGLDWRVVSTGTPVGFCDATARAWVEAATDGPDWIFWLENDFTFNREVDLDVIAAVMDMHPDVAQMALHRQPVSDEEIRHGGYLSIPSREGVYVPQLDVLEIADEADVAPEEFAWFKHRIYWTTNPSLFRRSVATEFDWPDGPGCEGIFGFILRAGRPGTTFGVWGDGEEWVSHNGQRTGKGY